MPDETPHRAFALELRMNRKRPITVPNPPFAHALVGTARVRNEIDVSNDVCIAIVPSPCPPDFTEKETGFAAAFGGGIDIRASNRIDIRVIQIDYNPTGVFDRTQHNFRIGVGIVFH